MAKSSALKPKRRVAWGGAKLAARHPRAGPKVLRVAGPGRPRRTRLVATGTVVVLGTYLLDPKNGKRRRRVVIDKAGKLLRRSEREAERKGRYAEGVAQGVAHKAGAGSDRAPAELRLNDPALARKVESEIFRDRHASKGAVNVMAENGVVSLRGEVESEREIRELVAAAQKVDGVRQVENLMHTRDTPAPHKPDGGPGSGAA
jgi:osmotically-inducible protein OsmY